MSRPALTIPPIVLFAAPDAGVWGVAAGGGPAQVAVARADAIGPVEPDPAELVRTAAGEWSVRRGEEALVAAEQPAHVAAEDGDPGFSLVRVAGSIEAQGIAYSGQAEAQAESVRMLFACFPEDHSLGLMAVRPARSKGQDRDALSVACLGEAEGNHVFDPRLSSTYGGDQLLRRVGVELWLGPSEEAELHSVRVAGEANGSVARLALDGVVVAAQPFTAHSRGRSGSGVYALVCHE